MSWSLQSMDKKQIHIIFISSITRNSINPNFSKSRLNNGSWDSQIVSIIQ